MVVEDTGLGSRVVNLFIVGFMLALVAATLFPIMHVAALSLSGSGPVMEGRVVLLPKEFTLDTYKRVLSDARVLRAYVNTLLYTLIGTAMNMAFTTLSAYAIANRRMIFRRPLTFLITFTMMFGGGLIPTYLVVRNLGMIDTLWAVTVPQAINTWNLLVMRQFFLGIPDSLEDSAMMDGANDFMIFARITLPLSQAVLAAMTLFYAVGHWNSFFTPLIYLNDPRKYPLQIILRQLVIQGQASMEEFAADQINVSSDIVNIKYTVIMVALIPVLVVYPIVQKHFVKGVLIGSIKG